MVAMLKIRIANIVTRAQDGETMNHALSIAITYCVTNARSTDDHMVISSTLPYLNLNVNMTCLIFHSQAMTNI